MKNFITYSFTILLILTCIIAFPFTLMQITGKAAGNPSKDMDLPAFNEPFPSLPPANSSSKGSVSDTDSSEGSSEAANENDKNSKTPEEDGNVPEFSEVTSDYFHDALFIGDSRTVGLSEYGDLGSAAIFASNGLSVYNAFTTEISIASVGKSSLQQLLENNVYGKVYIMLGINELGYDFNATISKYYRLVDTVKSLQPDAVIFIQANLHVTRIRSDSDMIYNNNNLDKFNEMIAALADNKTVFYIDVNKNFDDENGNLSEDYSTDNTHVLGKYYMDWSKWLCTKAILK